MTTATEEYRKLINSVNSNMCRGCTKIAERNGIILCYYSDHKIGFWNDLLNGWHCLYREKVIEAK